MGDRVEVECKRGVKQVAATTINQQFNILNNRKILSPRFKNVSRHIRMNVVRKYMLHLMEFNETRKRSGMRDEHTRTI